MPSRKRQLQAWTVRPRHSLARVRFGSTPWRPVRETVLVSPARPSLMPYGMTGWDATAGLAAGRSARPE